MATCVRWRTNVHVYSTLHFVSLLQPWSVAMPTCVRWRSGVHVYSTLHFVSLLQPSSVAMAMCTGCQKTTDMERCRGNVRWRTDVNVYSTLHSVSVLQSWGIAIVTCNRDRMSTCTVSFTLYHNCSPGALPWQHALKT